MTRWLRRRGFLDERPAEDRSNEAHDPTRLEACMQMSLFGGVFLRLAADGTRVPADEPRFSRAGTKSPWAAEVSGFNVHAGVTVRAGDREGLEKLCRYGARPPGRIERMSLLPDGRVAYLLRKPRGNGATHLVLDPVHFLARMPKKRRKKKEADVTAAQEPAPSSPRTSLGAGIVKPVGARIDWASLLRRIYLEDVLACPCGGRRRIIADVDDPSVIEAILSHLGLPTVAPPIARARSPAQGDAAA